MTQNVTTEIIVWDAWVALEEHFAMLGGAARYSGMRDIDIPIYICCRLIMKAYPNLEQSEFDQREYLDSSFENHASQVMFKVDSYLEKIEADSEMILNLAFDYVMHIDKKLSNKDRTTRWEKLSSWLGTHVSNRIE